MRELRSEITVNATPERVWEILTDFGSYSEWNPFMPRASGELKVDGKLEVRLDPPGGMGMTFKPRVTKVEPNREFRWLGHLFVPGIFDGEHIFEANPTGDNSCQLVQREEFRGVLSWLMLTLISKSTERGFHEMNEALKERAEAASSD